MFSRCHSDQSVFVKLAKLGMVIIIACVDDIVVSSNDANGSLKK